MKASLDARIAALAAGAAESEDALDACIPPSQPNTKERKFTVRHRSVAKQCRTLL